MSDAKMLSSSDMKEWDKRLDTIDGPSARIIHNPYIIKEIINVPVITKRLNEKELYNIWVMKYYLKDWTPYNRLSEIDKNRIDALNNDFEFDWLHSEAQGVNFMFGF